MTTGYLFLGGPADGTRKLVSNTAPTHVVLEYKPIGIPELGPARTVSVLEHVYTRRQMSGGYCVYAHTSLPTHEILPRLLRGYRPDAL
jgi:hypothetical protein